MKRIGVIIFSLFLAFTFFPMKANARHYTDEQYYIDLELLACLVQAEAGNQDLKGKELVADVVLNRVDSVKFPDNIEDVIFQEGQFTTVTNGELEKAFSTVTEDCYTAVYNEVESRTDSTILFFCSKYYNGVPCYKYGAHYFSR